MGVLLLFSGVVVCSLAVALSVRFVDAGGCQDSSLKCCEGRNNSCKGSGARLNNVSSSDCFCDSDCIEIGDCCLDYAVSCPAVDCILSDDWSDWSDCSATCGLGRKHRSRKVVVDAKNGGKSCGAITQKIRCEGEKCKHARAAHNAKELKERGNIIPAQFATWRRSKKYDPYKDIRKNLFEHYSTPETERPSYSAEFLVTDVFHSCNISTSTWSKRLRKGATVCVECQHFSMKKALGGRCSGHGVFQKTTDWKAVAIPGCHGKWTMTSRHRQDNACDPSDDYSFVLV